MADQFYRSTSSRESPARDRENGTVGKTVYSLSMRLLGLDFGEKRIGLATSDATGSVVTERRTLPRQSDLRVLEDLIRFCEEEEIEAIVIGIPRSPEGLESPMAARIRSFARKLARKTGLTIHEHEETLTSWQAKHERPSLRREEIDRAAAAVLLTDYLAHRPGEAS